MLLNLCNNVSFSRIITLDKAVHSKADHCSYMVQETTMFFLKKKSRTRFGLQMRSRSYLYPFIVLVVLYYFYLKVGQIVILSCFRPLSNSILVKKALLHVFNSCVTDGRTDRPTDERTDRYARTQKHYKNTGYI